MTLDSNPNPYGYPNHGYLLDGKSPRQQPLALRLFNGGIKYRLHSGKGGEWKFSETDWAQSPLKQQPLYLKGLQNEDAWLVITDPVARRHVVTAQRRWAQSNFWLVHAEKRTVVLSFGLIMLICVCLWLSWPLAADKIAAHAPPGLRAAINHLGDDYLDHEVQCSSPEAQVALLTMQTRLGQGRPQIQNLKLIVLDKGMVNAFTLPGNQVVITRGLLKQAKNSDEVAGVLAHEFGHVLNDHIVRGFIRNTLPKMVIAALAKALGSFASVADLAVDNAYSRGFEHDADATAIVLLHGAGISPKGLEGFFERMQAKSKDAESKLIYLSDHPASKDRAAMMAAAAAQDADIAKEPVLTDEQWHALQNVCDTPDAK